MRTDVKVGLVCVLILVIAVISYFAMQGKVVRETPVAQQNSRNSGATAMVAPPSHTPAATAPAAPVSAPVGTPAPAVAAAPADAPALGFHQPTSLGQTPSIYSPPGGSTTAPIGGTTLTPPGSPRTLLPPGGTDSPTTAPAVPPLTGGGLTAPGSGPPSLPGISPTPSGRDPEPYRPSLTNDPLLETGPRTTPGRTTPGGMPSHSTTIIPSGSGSTYMVQNGDNLTSIAKKNNTTVTALKAANPNINPDRLKLKQIINLPAPGSSTPSTSLTGTTPPRGPAATTRPAPSGATTIAPGSSYKVKKGDTLRKIAKAAYGDEKLYARIFRANRGEMSSANDLEPGMVLKIPAR